MPEILEWDSGDGNQCHIAFVILHYNALEYTKKCIESIKKLNRQQDIGIVVVDNASPNGSGNTLKELYKNDKQVKVLLEDENQGFSRGNNKGVLLARQAFNPDFYIVTNNDTEFVQPDMLDIIEKEYSHSHFGVMGPDVYVPEKNIHQSPMRENAPSQKEVKGTILLNKLFLTFYGLTANYMVHYFRKNKAKNTAMDYKKYQQQVCLCGACLIFDAAYIGKHIKQNPKCPVFAPETNFYFEEYFIKNWCDANAVSIVYQPQIQVLHHDGVATDMSLADEKKAVRFIMENTVAAAKIYENLHA